MTDNSAETTIMDGPVDLRRRLPIAINTFVWHSPLTDELLEGTLRTIAAIGYDAVELAYENPGDWDPNRASDLLTEFGLRSVVGGVFGHGRELVAAPLDTIEQTKNYVRSAVDAAVQQGSELVIGPMYTSVGRTWRSTAAERRTLITDLRENLKPLCDYAAERGVPLAFEPLNRYETSLLNTTEQMLELIDPLPPEGAGINLDVYHMNIEEKLLRDAFLAAGDRLLHLQVCGNDRGAPGDDHLDWQGIRKSLEEINYSGLLGFESFTADNDTIATAASIWRSYAATQDSLAEKAFASLLAWRSEWS